MFPSAVELGDHVRHHYLPNASDEHLSTVVARGEVSVSSDVTKECPLCRQAISGLKSYVKHTGRHLEQLALFALPSIEDEGLGDDVESDEQNDEASELGAISTDDNSWDASSKPHDGPHAMVVGHDGEGDVTAGETPDGEAPRPSAASPISYGEPVIESGRMKFDEELKAMIVAEAKAKLEEERKAAKAAAEAEAAAKGAAEELKKNVQEETKAKFE
ncbi:hypothetical protein ACKRZS_003729 [Fusarium odoratissimum]